jgi:hypothetical protein
MRDGESIDERKMFWNIYFKFMNSLWILILIAYNFYAIINLAKDENII